MKKDCFFEAEDVASIAEFFASDFSSFVNSQHLPVNGRGLSNLFFKTYNMVIKIINSLLILFAVFMGVKQGYAMLTGKPEMLELFGKWNFNKTALSITGIVTLASALLILHPKTFVWGNFLMAAGILLIICFQLFSKNLKGAAIELPFFLLNLLIIYLQHPLAKTNI